MSSVVLDTHAVIWYLEQSPLLSAKARGAIKAAVGAGYPVFVSTVSLAEMEAVPDMPDRMIAATALQLGFPLVTTDSAIRASGIPTIW